MTRYDEFLALRQQETDDCILWPYALNRGGYGQVRYNGSITRAHRLSCLLTYGEPPHGPGSDAAHSCHNRSCINPSHLRWASRLENMRDKVLDGTQVRGRSQNGSKLTEQDVWKIRFYARGGVKQSVIAKTFGVCQSSVSLIVNRKHWGWL